MAEWLRIILGEDGFPDKRSTLESKDRLQKEILKSVKRRQKMGLADDDRSRTAKKMRVALHEFALIARGLDNTTYGNATAI